MYSYVNRIGELDQHDGGEGPAREPIFAWAALHCTPKTRRVFSTLYVGVGGIAKKV